MKVKTLKNKLDNYFVNGDIEPLIVVKKENDDKNCYKILNVEKDKNSYNNLLYIIIENKQYMRIKSNNEKYYCGFCGYEILERYKYCPNCGERIFKNE